MHIKNTPNLYFPLRIFGSTTTPLPVIIDFPLVCFFRNIFIKINGFSRNLFLNQHIFKKMKTNTGKEKIKNSTIKIDNAVFKNKIFKLEKTPIFKPRYYFVLLKF